jgi:hypothetical protein
MALEIDFDICTQTACTEIKFTETTGIYQALSNPTGYGAPNPLVGDFVTATLLIIDPDGEEYEIDLGAESYPKNDDDGYVIPAVDIGSRTLIEDGYWQFVYTIVDGAAESYSATKTLIFSCNTNCCVRRLLLAINPDPNDTSVTNKKKIDRYLKAKIYLDLLKHYAYCGSTEDFDNLKLVIDKICENNGCDSCN